MPQPSHSYSSANSASTRSGLTAQKLSLREQRDKQWEREHENRQILTRSSTAPYVASHQYGSESYHASSAHKTKDTHSAYECPSVVNTAVIDRMVEYVDPPFGTARDSVTGKIPKNTSAAPWSNSRLKPHRSDRSGRQDQRPQSGHKRDCPCHYCFPSSARNLREVRGVDARDKWT